MFFKRHKHNGKKYKYRYLFAYSHDRGFGSCDIFSNMKEFDYEDIQFLQNGLQESGKANQVVIINWIKLK